MRGIRGTSRAQTDKTVAPTVISSGTHFVGRLESKEDLVLAGSFEGTIRTTKSVHLTPEAFVQGDIHAVEVQILGEVQGSILAERRIEIRTGAKISGDVCAPSVRVHEGVILNATVRMSALTEESKHYLVPALLKTFDPQPGTRQVEAAEKAAERFLAAQGFELESLPRGTSATHAIRPIFKSREALPYDALLQRMQQVGAALESATKIGGETPDGTTLQSTGAAGVDDLMHAMAGLRNAALMVGPVALRWDERNGKPVSCQIRPQSLSKDASNKQPDPAQLLIELQRIQNEMLQEMRSSDR